MPTFIKTILADKDLLVNLGLIASGAVIGVALVVATTLSIQSDTLDNLIIEGEVIEED